MAYLCSSDDSDILLYGYAEYFRACGGRGIIFTLTRIITLYTMYIRACLIQIQ